MASVSRMAEIDVQMHGLQQPLRVRWPVDDTRFDLTAFCSIVAGKLGMPPALLRTVMASEPEWPGARRRCRFWSSTTADETVKEGDPTTLALADNDASKPVDGNEGGNSTALVVADSDASKPVDDKPMLFPIRSSSDFSNALSKIQDLQLLTVHIDHGVDPQKVPEQAAAMPSQITKMRRKLYERKESAPAYDFSGPQALHRWSKLERQTPAWESWTADVKQVFEAIPGLLQGPSCVRWVVPPRSRHRGSHAYMLLPAHGAMHFFPFTVPAREKEIGASGGLLDPPGPLLTHLHTVYIAYSECLPTPYPLDPPG
jgi:hypothetical protein